MSTQTSGANRGIGYELVKTVAELGHVIFAVVRNPLAIRIFASCRSNPLHFLTLPRPLKQSSKLPSVLTLSLPTQELPTIGRKPQKLGSNLLRTTSKLQCGGTDHSFPSTLSAPSPTSNSQVHYNIHRSREYR